VQTIKRFGPEAEREGVWQNLESGSARANGFERPQTERAGADPQPSNALRRALLRTVSAAVPIPSLFALQPKNAGFAPAVCANLISPGHKESFWPAAIGSFQSIEGQSLADWPAAKTAGELDNQNFSSHTRRRCAPTRRRVAQAHQDYERRPEARHRDRQKGVAWPARQIAINFSEDGLPCGRYGVDAQTGEFSNLVTKGTIDPTKVVRIALQDGASIAGLLITTKAMVVEPKKE
jgi:chaperonin GroEL